MNGSDTIFRFKHFCVAQDKCAMKVGTDSVLLGAWAGKGDIRTILDVGAGTGIIAMMLAQRFAIANIKAIEISNEAADECNLNFKNCMWNTRLNVINGDFRTYRFSNETFDLIVSNPPYFHNGIKASERNRAIARHNDTLSAQDVIRLGANLLNDGGKIALITPAESENDLIFAATMANMTPTRLTRVCSIYGKSPIRLLSEFSKGRDLPVHTSTFSIRDRNNNLTDEYIRLTNDFYLNL